MGRKKRKVKVRKNGRYGVLAYLILAVFGYLVYKCGNNETLFTEKIDKLEIPIMQDSGSSGRIVVHSGYALSYNSERLLPDWVAYELTSLETEGDNPRAEHFQKDPFLSGLQADNDDYRNSGWDKGHMAPAADMKWDETAMKESFYLSNVCPQNHKLNSGTWKKLEEQCRKYAQRFGSVYIVCGPVIKNNKYGTIGDNGVMVPDGFYKVLLAVCYGKYIGIGFLFDNEKGNKNLMKHAVSIDEVERITGIDFFPSLPDDEEQRVEACYDEQAWSL